MPRKKPMLLNILQTGALVYAVLLVLIFFVQGRLLFIPSAALYRSPESMGWPYEDLMLPVGSHTTHGWYIPAEGESKGVFLFSHGNAGNIADRLESISIFRNLGYDVLAYDYGGYGKSSGSPSEQRCYDDIRAMWDYLIETRNTDPNDIILFGRSLGGGPACQLATEVKARAVILESTFQSVAKRAFEIYPVFPMKLLIRNRFDNAEKVPKIKSPLLIVHSKDDTLIPPHHGRELFRLASEPKQFLEIKGDHNEGFWMSGDLYTNGLQDFLATIAASPKNQAPAQNRDM